MITIKELLRLCQYCDHTITIYSECMSETTSVTCGELLWSSESNTDLPEEISRMRVLAYDLEDTIYRIWVDAGTIADKYKYDTLDVDEPFQSMEYYH